MTFKWRHIFQFHYCPNFNDIEFVGSIFNLCKIVHKLNIISEQLQHRFVQSFLPGWDSYILEFQFKGYRRRILNIFTINNLLPEFKSYTNGDSFILLKFLKIIEEIDNDLGKLVVHNDFYVGVELVIDGSYIPHLRQGLEAQASKVHEHQVQLHLLITLARDKLQINASI